MKKLNLILSLLAIMLFPVSQANAFSLNYKLIDQIYEGKEFKVDVSIDKGSFLIKAIEGLINFDSESFKIVEIIKNSSVFEKWIAPPYLNEDGQISFSGIFNSDLTDNNLFTIVFEKINNDNNNFELNMNSGAILTEDDRLYSLEEMIPIKEESSIFRIISLTHPDPESWHSNKIVKLSWDIPEDAQKIKILIDNEKESYPTIEYNDPIIKEKEVELENGIWYFHIRYFGDNGWSQIEHRKIMIDGEKPKTFDVRIGIDKIEFFGEDELSGIEAYEINIPLLEQKYLIGENSFELSQIRSGSYIAKLRAYDKAQNYLEREEVIKIKEVSAPNFSEVVPGKNEIFVLGYVDSPNAKVYISINGNDTIFEDVTGVSDNGKFVCLIENLLPGLYDLNLMTIADNGVSIKNKKAILVINKRIDSNIPVQILIASGIAILALLLVYIFYKKDKKKINKSKKTKI